MLLLLLLLYCWFGSGGLEFSRRSPWGFCCFKEEQIVWSEEKKTRNDESTTRWDSISLSSWWCFQSFLIIRNWKWQEDTPGLICEFDNNTYLMLLKGLAQFRIYELVVLINKPFGAWLVGNYYYLQAVLWIRTRNRIHMDPHWFGCPGSGSVLAIWIRIQIQEELDQN